jgi:hypothetical protein
MANDLDLERVLRRAEHILSFEEILAIRATSRRDTGEQVRMKVYRRTKDHSRAKEYQDLVDNLILAKATNEAHWVERDRAIKLANLALDSLGAPK